MTNTLTRTDDLIETKKTVSLFCTTKESPLTYADLLVYCFRAYQDAFSTVPAHRRVAKATGLKEETVAKATVRLRDLGLLNGDASVITPCPHLDWFRQLDSLLEKFGDKHFSLWFQNWRCFVRAPGADNPLTVPSVMVYSLIRHAAMNNCKPRFGWSHEYIALVTGMTTKTVGSALEKLVATGFLAIEEGLRFKLFKLRQCQLRFLADRQEWTGNSSVESDDIVDEFSPVSDDMELKDKQTAAFRHWLQRWPISEAAKNKVYYGIVNQPNWFKGDWNSVAMKAVGKFMEIESNLPVRK